MRKLTYTQAATCGENLKVRVTPEQSEKMQLAWFAAGKTWSNGLKKLNQSCSGLFLSKDGVLKWSWGDGSYFDDHLSDEIELIDDLPQHDFASQQEVLGWMLQGNKVKDGDDPDVFGFKDGHVFNFTTNQKADCGFHVPSRWKKHTPPRLIRVNGIEVPAPLESVDGLTFVWVVKIGHDNNVESYRASCDFAQKMLALKMCYANKEDAIKRAEAMRLFEVVE